MLASEMRVCTCSVGSGTEKEDGNCRGNSERSETHIHTSVQRSDGSADEPYTAA
jgi:hypothetical protein